MPILLAMVFFDLSAGQDAAGKFVAIGTLETRKPDEPASIFQTAQARFKLEYAAGATAKHGKKAVPISSLPAGAALLAEGTTEGKAGAQSIKIDKATVVDSIQGKIVSIMETFPLRIELQTDSGSIDVQLENQTRTFRDSKVIDNNALRGGQRMQVFGRKDVNSITAFELWVIVDKKSQNEKSNPK